MAALRVLDLIVLGLALPIFLAAGFPLTGWLAGGGAWLLQRGIQVVLERRAKASNDPRTVVGLTAGSMIARGWMVALIIFFAGLSAGNKTGLSAAVLVIALFTIYFTVSMILRPFDQAPS